MEHRLSTPGYEGLVDASRTYRQRLVVRLAGEAGLRASEIGRLRPSDRRELDDFHGSALRVRETDGERTAYIPPGLDAEFVRYVNSSRVSDDERLIDVSERRIQMVVSEAGEAAADETGIEDLRDVSPGDLRDRFARHALVEEGLDPNAVKTAGGWSSLGSLERHVEEPCIDEVFTAFERERTRRASDTSLVAVVEAAVEADDRDEKIEAVCEALASAYGFAWMERLGVDGTPSIEAVFGASEDTVDGARAELPDKVDGVSVADDVGDAGEVLAVPVEHGGRRFGTVGVGSKDGFGGDAYDSLGVVGRHLGHALTAERRRKALSADTVVEIELRTTDDGDFLVSLSDRFGCEFDLRSVVSSSESVDILHVTLRGTDSTNVLEAVGDFEGVDDFRLVEQEGSEALIEFSVSGGSVVRLLHGYGTRISKAVFDEGSGMVVADSAHGLDLQTVVDGIKETFPQTYLAGKHEVDREPQPTQGFVEDVTARLTDRQEDALRAAYFGGYFDWPRGSTAEEIADSMDISSPTLHNHLRKGQREILSALFDE
ncbi:helix-turn-helix domain-containing protein [Haladaptatus sp. F3-133]|uniref:Helix-turn-helix domain-containing protein n=1 Tax=Halorutilus salinus TaxID=2487751 RepID=A0A9Q4GGV5_9EURY|nr:bacterio-opsin activator domain-containing protein [Halorutilus salinus]MCX2819127.1 helix-turn-helix domain-containing protein [Halorutilus salinus]